MGQQLNKIVKRKRLNERKKRKVEAGKLAKATGVKAAKKKVVTTAAKK